MRLKHLFLAALLVILADFCSTPHSYAAYESYTWPNGDTYHGEWKGNKKHGQGTYTYANGNKYVGQYYESMRHGHGTFYFGEFKFKGEWVYDRPATDGNDAHAAYGHYLWGEEYGHKQQYRKAIIEYNKALSRKHNKWIAFSCYNNTGIIYLHAGDSDQASHSFKKAAEAWPERAYYPYMGLSSLAYKQGNIEKSAEYRQKAFDLVQGSEYKKLEQIYSGYDTDTLKKWVTTFYDSSQLHLAYTELQKQYARRNYREVKRLGEEILRRKYHAGLGVSVEGTFISSVSEEGIASLNGIVEGDRLVEVDGKPVVDSRTAITELANLYDRFGDKINIKIRRKHREITMECHMYYPELETTKRMLREAKRNIAAGNLPDLSKDTEAPRILVLKPGTRRGLTFVAKDSIDFVIIAADNVGVKSLHVDGKSCEPLEGTFAERSLLQGNTKKYRATVRAVEGKKQVTIRAQDADGNVTTKDILLKHSPQLAEKQADFYEHGIAVVIGINKYTLWPSLEFSVSDAEALKEKLQIMGFHRIIELYDHEATKLQINRLLRDTLPKMLGENDRLLIYFAGHGQTETYQHVDNHGQVIKEKEGYIIPVNGEQTNYRGTAISMTSIREAAKDYEAKHVLYVFDSCYSGLGLKRSGGIKKADDYIMKLLSMKAVQIITAGGEDEQVGEEKGHGIFTRYVLLALGGNADLDKDGFITASEIGTYVRPAVSRKTENMQTPKYGWISGEGDFVFWNLASEGM
ncbi:MAG: caspase family protein [Deltaproteobacteria bacterium]|nr:caspase family protein [Deltaproteobacteria bacterium]